MFVATLSYELDASTSTQAAKLLRAELVGRRYNDHYEGKPMPLGCLWIQRSTDPGETVDHLLAKSEREIHAAVAAVAGRGLPIGLARAWVQVSGAGTWGLVRPLGVGLPEASKKV